MNTVVSPGPDGTEQKACAPFSGCVHENVDWQPVEMEYGAQGLAVVVQLAICRNCKHEVQASADLEDAIVASMEE